MLFIKYNNFACELRATWEKYPVRDREIVHI